MEGQTTNEKKPLVGFFPPFHSLADTGRLVLIAKRFREMDGNAIFFSHGGQYEYLAKDNGFEIIQINPILSTGYIQEMWKYISTPTYKNIIQSYFSFLFSTDYIQDSIEHEIDTFKKTEINMIVSAFVPSCSISTRVSEIPYVCIVSEAGAFQVRTPDMIENIFTRSLPQPMKLRFFNRFMSKTKLFVKPFNKASKKFHVPSFRCIRDVYKGDITLETNALEFINIFPDQQTVPTHDYVGPILLGHMLSEEFSEEGKKQMEEKIESHLKKPGRSILVTLGSVGRKDLFLRILRVLNKTNYNIVAVNVYGLDEKEKEEFHENIFIAPFIPFIEKLHYMVDVSLIHGGQGTVYAAAYAGKPVIGFPLQLEQHSNLEKFVGHGAGILGSIKYFDEKQLLADLEEIFNHYQKYLMNAQNLAKKLPPPRGDENAALRLMEILSEHQRKK